MVAFGSQLLALMPSIIYLLQVVVAVVMANLPLVVVAVLGVCLLTYLQFSPAQHTLLLLEQVVVVQMALIQLPLALPLLAAEEEAMGL
jgi:hypothetical protein